MTRTPATIKQIPSIAKSNNKVQGANTSVVTQPIIFIEAPNIDPSIETLSKLVGTTPNYISR